MKKKIGTLERGVFGWGYFVCYCEKCKNKIVINTQEAEQFVDALGWKKQSIVYLLKKRLVHSLPKVRITIERGEGIGEFTPLLTNGFKGNIIEYMKKKEIKIMSERTKKILEDRSTGKSIVELGSIYGLTRQRIWAILKQYGDTLPKELSTEG